ncbi:hypothetical protein [Clostridium tagluense]|uniref:Uncharacterized protein n=1 Tax=Clostridium tagluense TaxID=360422 RepID=A0A401UQM3_9CLOT|nr:hypothetical protein [Clostridium tagluense]GCD11820.1 hypothetical protein Ctaglu_34430 [Clostridium tagluense]
MTTKGNELAITDTTGYHKVYINIAERVFQVFRADAQGKSEVTALGFKI